MIERNSGRSARLPSRPADGANACQIGLRKGTSRTIQTLGQLIVQQQKTRETEQKQDQEQNTGGEIRPRGAGSLLIPAGSHGTSPAVKNLVKEYAQNEGWLTKVPCSVSRSSKSGAISGAIATSQSRDREFDPVAGSKTPATLILGEIVLLQRLTKTPVKCVLPRAWRLLEFLDV
jgi:hypothetical protein